MRKRAAVNVLLALYVAVAVARVVRNTASPDGGKDFHPYWYASQLLRQGIDPYAAFLGGRVDRGEPLLPAAPAVTAPLLAAALPFSFLPWKSAKWAWLIVALATLAIAPRFAFAAAKRYAIPVDALTPTLLFFALLATRVAAGNGQLVCPVIALLILAVAAPAPWLAGIALGFALSKYSVAVAVVVFFLLRREWRVLAIAAAVQATGVAALWVVTGSTPLAIVREYAAIARMHAAEPGYQFPSPAIDVVIAAALLAIAFWRWPRRQFDILAMLCAGSLLVVYHRVYDGVLLLPAIVVLLPAMRSSIAVRIAAASALFVLMLPGTILGSETWTAVAGDAQRYAVVLLLAVIVYLVTREPAAATA
jgi:hypothetical protein